MLLPLDDFVPSGGLQFSIRLLPYEQTQHVWQTSQGQDRAEKLRAEDSEGILVTSY